MAPFGKAQSPVPLLLAHLHNLLARDLTAPTFTRLKNQGPHLLLFSFVNVCGCLVIT
jgi:hypothetical protein